MKINKTLIEKNSKGTQCIVNLIFEINTHSWKATSSLME